MSGYPNNAGTVFAGGRDSVATAAGGKIVAGGVAPLVGNVWSALLIGGASADVGTRCLHPTVLARGYLETVREHVERARAFGASNVVILNPGGTDAGDMQFDQWLLAWPDVRERARRAVDFSRAVGHASAVFGRMPAVYLGAVHPRSFPKWSDLERAELTYAVRESVAFVPRGCRVVIDMAGADLGGLNALGLPTDVDLWSGGVSERVAAALLSMGVMVGCEPWPLAASRFSDDRRAMGFTNSAYLRRVLSGDESGGGRYGLKVDRSRGVAARQVAVVAEDPEPSPQELIAWLAMGIGVAVNPGADGTYHGFTAEDLLREARAVVVKAVK